MKLVLMGAGYVGMPLLQQTNKKYSFSVTTTSPEKVEGLKAYANEVLLINPLNINDLRKLLLKSDGAIILIAPKNHANYASTYLETAKIIVSCLENHQKPFYLLYSSSTSVYEGSCETFVNEDMPLAPSSENAKILLETEGVFSQLNSCILRLGGIYGPGRELESRARRMSGLTLPGTGDEPTNSIHRDDIVSAIQFCVERQLTGTYNLVNDDHPTRKELYEGLCHSLNLPPPHWDSTTSEKRSYLVDNRKIKDAGFIPTMQNMAKR